MNPRNEQILRALLKEFIQTGEPVGSRKLAKKYDFRVRDATIRNELNSLMQEGFLEQPHTSSGRVPTDKAYRFFVDQLFADFAHDFLTSFEREFNAILTEFSQGEFFGFVSDMSDYLGVLSVGYDSETKQVYKSGLDELFEQLVANDWNIGKREIYEIARDIELLDRKMDELLNFLERGEQPKVFIGQSPVTKSPYLSVIADRFESDREDFVVAAIGPKRMDYEEGIKFFMQLRRRINS